MKEVRKTLAEASRLTNIQPTKDIINNANIVKTAFNNYWNKDLEIINNEEPLIEVESDLYNNSLIISYKESNIKFICSF
jgi:hypothetical protein